ncbi:MAG: LON peptidase substrate-binding domain-containing protein [Myxococcaceae bacterium]
MTLEDRLREASSHLKVFPLPSVVMLPGSVVPLHIFEPRYRAMVKDALDGDGIIAVGQLQPGWESNYSGRPALHPLCCTGIILWHEQLPDGRYNLLLQGTSRFRIDAELPAKEAYREVRGAALHDPEYAGPEVDLLREAVLELTGRVPPPAAEALAQVAARASGGALADAVAAALVGEAPRRYEVLCELDPRRRLRSVLSDVADLIANLAPVATLGPLN